MSYQEIARILGAFFYFFACAMCIPLLTAAYFQFIAAPEVHPQPHTTLAFAISVLACLALATLLHWFGRKGTGVIYRKEGLFIVVCIWFLTAFVAGLPFFVSGTLQNPLDAYFESISGLTTTGATVMAPKAFDATTGQEIPIVSTVDSNPKVTYSYYGTITPLRNPETGEVIATGLEAVSQALLLWRSFIQWIGGMGIVVLFLAILPALGVGGKVLYQAEVPGPVKDSLTPRVRDTAGLLWKIYIALSVIQVLLLYTTNPNMPFFDALLITFSSISTGGFTAHSDSIGYYNSATTQWIVLAFMLIGSISFVHYVHIIKRKLTRLAEPELIVYLSALIVGVVIVMLSLVGSPEIALSPSPAPDETFSWFDSFRYGAFQLVSCWTSTGFATSDYNNWPFVCQVILLSVMFIGGMSGSTAGGVKIIRHTMLVRITGQRIERIFRPHAVRAIHIGQAEVDTNRAMTVLTFFFIAISLTLLGTFLFVVDGVDPQTSLSTMACMLNNIGIGFRAAGPTESFAFLHAGSKILSIIWMVMGRLEYFALLILFLPDFWRSR